MAIKSEILDELHAAARECRAAHQGFAVGRSS